MASQQSQGRPRSKSMLSFGSVRSHRSTGSGGKIDLTETAKEKAGRRMTSKADPTKAMNEAQPAAQAQEGSTLESIRNMQHKDASGNIITDPDLSNPTRPRLERPLDTIRSFEAAIDGSYSRRFSTRVEPLDSAVAQSRRSSYFMGYHNTNTQQRFPGDSGGYYGNPISNSRPESYVDNGAHQPGHHSQARRFGPRNVSDPALYGKNSNNGVYPTHGYQQSYDTVTSGTGSHATDQWGTSTDPSSENSSVDKINQAPKPDLAEAYGFSGFGGAPQFQGPILEEHGQGAPAYGQPGYGQSQGRPSPSRAYQGNGIPPAPPPHAVLKDSSSRVPIKLGTSSGTGSYTNGTSQGGRTDGSEKRKSWLKRRFSKKN
ncbi:hypothetical protein MMC17_003438 [Xylographa soralifera]|nr:hypothetical protein [Xylographa soralifera]